MGQYFSSSPHWTWYIIPYFFVGGIAGGSLFLYGLLRLMKVPDGGRVAHLAAHVAFAGAIASGILLVLDLPRPERFWHMLVQSETLRPMFKWWSPMSFGAWGLLGFGIIATLAMLSARYEAGQLRLSALAWIAARPGSVVIAIGGIVSGAFFAGYTGVLLSVTNRPIWADSNWIGMLFLFSGISTAAALLIILARRRGSVVNPALSGLARFETAMLVAEFVALIVFLISLGAASRAFLGVWGVVLALGVVGAGILVPLAHSSRRIARLRDRPVFAGMLVLAGGFLLRVVVMLSAQTLS